MESETLSTPPENQNHSRLPHDLLLKLAMNLSLFTIFYNLLEGGLATWFGASDETLALFGFGLDSFVEVLSGLGIAHMIYRMQRNPISRRDAFEKKALQITAVAFYFLTAGLVLGAGLSIYTGAQPRTTWVGIIISAVSILTMYVLYRAKLRVGQRLDSAPMISDARCTLTCFYLSFILLGSSLLYEIFALAYVDALGSLGIAYYAFQEGKEAFEKARTGKLTCGNACG